MELDIIKQMIALCRKEGIKSFKFNGLEVEFWDKRNDAPITQMIKVGEEETATTEVDQKDQKSLDDELLFWSSNN